MLEILDASHSSLGANQKQFYRDAMRLGACVSNLIYNFKKMQCRYKTRYFDIWKLQTLLKQPRPHPISFNDTMSSSYHSDCIQILQLSRPFVIQRAQSPSSVKSISSGLKERGVKLECENRVRKALLAIGRFKARRVMNAFYNWKYGTKHNATVGTQTKEPTDIDESCDENMTDEEEELKCPTCLDGTAETSNKMPTKQINEMSTKLPFSNCSNRISTDQRPDGISDRVLAGLVPSKTNKTKALSKEQERLYTQILESETKNFSVLWDH